MAVSPSSGRRGSENAIRRMSRRCPVVIRINSVLDDEEFDSVAGALERIAYEVDSMPEGAATRDLINRILEVDSYGCSSESGADSRGCQSESE